MDDAYFMGQALKEARHAFEIGEVPIGAIIVLHNRIIARGHNLTVTLNDVTAHAEMQAFTSAANTLGGKYLIDCTLYVTLEPCVMCAGAAFWTQIGRIVYGADDPLRGFLRLKKQVLHPQTIITGGILAEESKELIRDFFSEKR